MTDIRASEDELVQRLAELPDAAGAGVEPTLAAIKAEIQTLADALRTPPAANPFAAEPALARALEQVAGLAAEYPSEAPTTAAQPTGSSVAAAPQMLGQYQLLEQLGAGGMGTVYRAVHPKLNRTVALKVLPADRFQSPDAVARFEREMQAVARLQHPNVVAAYDAGEVDSRHFLVMEFVDGEDVGRLLSRSGPFPIAEACEIVRQAALGLQAICDDGLVHRDIKPSNLMLAQPRNRKGAPTVKILDLGLALLDPSQSGTARELTSTGQIMGTIDYMAPEQGLDTHHVDIRADLYSLGATLYKLLTGRAPLDDPRLNTAMKRLIALEREQPPPLSALRPDCPPALSDLVQRLLSKSPADRPSQPQAVAEALAPFAEGANLQALLEGAIGAREAVSASPYLNATFVTSSPTQVEAPQSATVEGRRPPGRRRRLVWFAALPIAALLAAVIYIATDKGQVTIDAPDDLTENVSVTLLRNGAAAVANWQIQPGGNAHRIQTGTVEVRLPADAADEFELQPLGDLVVRRGGAVAYRLTRRAPVATNSPLPPADPSPGSAVARWGLDFNHRTTPGVARVELPLQLRPADPCTIEMYATPRSLPDQWENRQVFTCGGRISLKQLGSQWDWGVWLGAELLSRITSPGPLQVGRRVHLAGVATGKQIRFFVDGQPMGRADIGFDLPTEPYAVVLGGTGLDFPSWTPFDGLIEQVRISKIARYEGEFTPAPEFAADAETLALYRFDEGQGDMLKDSSGNGRHGKIVGAKWVRLGEPGASATGLKLATPSVNPSPHVAETKSALDFNARTDDGASARVNLKYVTDPSRPLTIELFVTPRTQCPDGMNRLVFGAGSRLMLKQTALGWHWHSSNAQVVQGRPVPLRRVHLAAVSADRQLKLFEDGKLLGHQQIDTPIEAGVLTCTLGAQVKPFEGWEPLDALIDQFRWSTTARYDRDFVPPERLTADESTFILHNFDEGAGDLLKDSSGNGHHGKIVGAQWVRVDAPRPATPSTSTASAVSQPLQIAEPPALVDWLKGRVELTVAQDGTGVYRTIQAALDALEPGQVVKVLDAGPYRESLRLDFVPKDCGLVSEVRTTIELPTSADGPPLHFGPVSNFRVNGFRFRGTAATREAPLAEWVSPVGLVIENCAFRMELGDGLSYRAVDVSLHGADGKRESVLFRECAFEGGDLNFLGRGDRAELLVLRNYFGQTATLTLSKIDRIDRMLFRYNVCANSGPIFRQLKEVGRQLEVSNNSMVGIFTKFNFLLPETGVVLKNNFAQVGIQFHGGDLEPRTQPPHGWQVSHNFSGFMTKNNTPLLLSLDPPNPNYLRPAPESSLATRGAGGSWPNHVGALPPGPAPADGDWFTRLRERWLKAAPQ